MRNREQRAFAALCQLFSHQRCDLQNDDINLPPDLFDSEQWYAWGLNKKQLATVSAMTGAAAGAAIDVAVAGHSFMLGAISGGVVGFASAWLGADKLTTTKLVGLPLGGFQASQGPINNKNFPYVVVGRFLHLFEQLKTKNHADRSSIILSEKGLNEKLEMLQKTETKALHLACKNLSAQKPNENLQQVLLVLLDVDNV